MKYFFKRALAYSIDITVCYSFVMLVFQWAILSNLHASLGITKAWFANSLNMELYVLLTISLPVWIYFTYFDSKQAKGTLGKRVVKLEVYDAEHKRIALGKSFFRTFFKLLPWELAHLGVIFPTPMYFEETPALRTLTIFGILLFSAYLLSILISPTNQSIYDKVVGTKVSEV